MKLSSIMGNSQKLDGGAMFGNAPRALWSRWLEPDAWNRIDLACRALLVETRDKKILFETGIGAFMAPRLKERFGVQESHHVLLDSLKKLGLAHDEIDTVILSHLHFDHAGGLLSQYREGAEPELLFPNALFYVSEPAWERALHPHPRDRVSFVPHLNGLLKECGRLRFLEPEEVLRFHDLEVRFHPCDGHTPGMLVSDLAWPHGRLLFAADLIPGRPWVHLPITMGYDRFPEKLIDEKRALLTSVAREDAWLFYTHDSEVAATRVIFESKQRFRAGESLAALDRLSVNHPDWPAAVS